MVGFTLDQLEGGSAVIWYYVVSCTWLKIPKKADKDRCVEKDLKHRPENMASKATDYDHFVNICTILD